jgi:hypothetical protein
MPAKKTAKKTTKKAPKKATKKAAPKKKATTKIKKGQAYECGICGYRIIIDEVCGCAEEHLFICCDKQMKKKRAKRKA